MAKSKIELELLRDRVKAVRDNFMSNPEIRWLPLFRKDHPQFADHKIRNVYYLYSTDAEITDALEKHFEKYSPKISK